VVLRLVGAARHRRQHSEGEDRGVRGQNAAVGSALASPLIAGLPAERHSAQHGVRDPGRRHLDRRESESVGAGGQHCACLLDRLASGHAGQRSGAQGHLLHFVEDGEAGQERMGTYERK